MLHCVSAVHKCVAGKMLLYHFPSVFYTKWTKLDLKDDATGAVVVLLYILLMGAHGAQKDVHIHMHFLSRLP